MSGEAPNITIPSANVGDVQPALFTILQNGAVFRAAPAAVAELEAQGFRINDIGELLINSSGGALALEATLSAINAKLVNGNDIGDVTINNAAGGAAVNIQDGGNSLTVDTPQLPTTLGAKTNANSLSITLASDLGAIPVAVDHTNDSIRIGDGVRLALVTTAFELQTKDQGLPATIGIKTAALSTGVVLASDHANVPTTLQTSIPAGTNNIGDVDVLTLPDVAQATHDNLNLNANLQVGDADVGLANAVPILAVAPAAKTVKQAQITVGVAAVRLTTDAAVPTAGRDRLDFRPDGDSSARFFYGGSGVTTANGEEVFPGESVQLLNDANDYFIISDTAAQTVGIVEVE